MKFRTKVFYSLLLFIFPFGIFRAFAQLPTFSKKDTSSSLVDSTHFFSFDENGYPYGNSGNEENLINQLDGFQDFQPRQASTGNAGAPEKPLIQVQYLKPIFRRSQNSFSYFGFQNENRKFYDSEKPYTKIQFIVGQKQEINVGVIHSHPFGRNCNVAFGFNRIRSTGFYQRQNTNNTSVNLNGWYRAPGGRYALLSNIYWTGIDAQENGGIARDADFENSHQLDRKIVAVNLAAAETRERFRGVWIKQYWSFGKGTDTISSQNDSLHLQKKISPSWAIVHSVNLSDEKYIYSDQNPLSGYYQNVFRDTVQTKDSTYLWKLGNGIWIERFDFHNSVLRKFSGKVGVTQELGEISNDTIYHHFLNYISNGRCRFDLEKRILKSIDVNGYYVVSGTNKSDYLFQTNLSSSILKWRVQYFISAQTALQQPEFLFSNYSGNHFRWKNDFYQCGITNVNAGILRLGEKQPVSVSLGYYRYDSPIYFGTDQLPEQLIGTVNAFEGKLNWLTGTKSIKIKTDLTWNNLPSNSPIRLPEFILRESIYGNFHLFKNALQLQVGVDGTWFSAYYADAYNPNISQFYLQDSKKIGNFILLDPWLSIKVKPVRIFVKADHINAKLMESNYYQIPHYPLNDLALKFGLSWVFND